MTKVARLRSKRTGTEPRPQADRVPSANRATRSVVGDLVNFRGLVYAPVNESGVVFLFGKVAADLNMYVEEIKTGFPDCIARRFTGKGWERVAVEFEYCSSHFRQHGHDHRQCDIIVCWEHDWPTCPIEVIELRERIKELENTEIARPGDLPVGPQGDIKDWAKRHGIRQSVIALFDSLWDNLHKKDNSVFYKVGDKLVSFYSPERAFLFVCPRKSKLRFNVFTAGSRLGAVKQYEFERGAEKWGGLAISTGADLAAALPWVGESLNRIRSAIKRNEPTGWYARLDESTDD